jgi:hypothetical protein
VCMTWVGLGSALKLAVPLTTCSWTACRRAEQDVLAACLQQHPSL